LFVVLLMMTPSSQELGPPANPGRFKSAFDFTAELDQVSRDLSLSVGIVGLALQKLQLRRGGVWDSEMSAFVDVIRNIVLRTEAPNERSLVRSRPRRVGGNGSKRCPACDFRSEGAPC
jgi:hypothetical protein